jgi:hypothetical protein
MNPRQLQGIFFSASTIHLAPPARIRYHSLVEALIAAMLEWANLLSGKILQVHFQEK